MPLLWLFVLRISQFPTVCPSCADKIQVSLSERLSVKNLRSSNFQVFSLESSNLELLSRNTQLAGAKQLEQYKRTITRSEKF